MHQFWLTPKLCIHETELKKHDKGVENEILVQATVQVPEWGAWPGQVDPAQHSKDHEDDKHWNHRPHKVTRYVQSESNWVVGLTKIK